MKFAIPFRPKLLAPWDRRVRERASAGQYYPTGRDTLKKYSGKDFTAVIGVPQRGIAVCTIMAGVILLVMGMTRMGTLNKS